MAKDFSVPFLGSVPIDPAFIALIEEGKRPSYPEGTVIAGQEVSKQSDMPENDNGSLVEKYQDCSLFTVFDNIVGQLVANAQP
jgi:hypothetical protein